MLFGHGLQVVLGITYCAGPVIFFNLFFRPVPEPKKIYRCSYGHYCFWLQWKIRRRLVSKFSIAQCNIAGLTVTGTGDECGRDALCRAGLQQRR